MEEKNLSEENLEEKWIERILRSLEGLEYGSIQIVVHDSQIMQIERVEKYRFPIEKSGTSKGRSHDQPKK